MPMSCCVLLDILDSVGKAYLCSRDVLDCMSFDIECGGVLGKHCLASCPDIAAERCLHAQA